jgi:hypothetical protein
MFVTQNKPKNITTIKNWNVEAPNVAISTKYVMSLW